MSVLMLASVRTRLAQVGTCLTTNGISVLSGQGHFRQIYSNGRSPAFSRALVRPDRRVSPQMEYRQLLEEVSGLEEKMADVKKGSELPVITIPIHLEKRLEKKLQVESTKRANRLRILADSRKGQTNQVLISCKRREFNHYNGQSYGKKDSVMLASGSWKHKKSAGDHFTVYPGYKRKKQFHMGGTESMTFADLQVREELCENLKRLNIEKPTHIQVFAIPHLRKGGYNVVAAETGCGKTLAYLVPAINQILDDQRFKVRQLPGHPSTIVLLPSRELADQVYKVAKSLTVGLDISIKLLQGGNMDSKSSNPPKKNPTDILITTSNALKVLLESGAYGIGKVLHVVLDEADTLLDDSFFPDLVAPFLHRLPWDDKQRRIQITLVSATLPKGLKDTLGSIIDVSRMSYCTTPGLHHSLPHVPQTFLRLRKSQKPDKILELVQADFDNNVPVLIFCNKSATCDWLAHHLNDAGIDCFSVHGRMPPRGRRGRVDMYQRGDINVLIATDLASRGIDTVRTQHVINYEFPLFMADYIHRCGRTGRVGSEKGCHVTNFVSRPGEIGTVNDIEWSVRKEKELPDVNANIKRLYGQHYGSYTEIQPIDDERVKVPSKKDETANDNNFNDDSQGERIGESAR